MQIPQQQRRWHDPFSAPFWGQVSSAGDRCYAEEAPAEAVVVSARFGVATSDRGEVLALASGVRKPKVVNEILPTRCGGLTEAQKAASQAAFQNRAENFFSPMT